MPLVIPIFIPHEGCPHCCVFCNQQKISGFTVEPVTGDDVTRIITTWLERSEKEYDRVQVAFYGGSFTGLARARQNELLAAVAPFVAQGRVASIRLSTRPDYIDRDIIEFLQRHYVGTVELGVQSMSDAVLTLSGRGHNAADVIRAMGMLAQSGLETGIQLMLGLPGENRRILRKTVEQVIGLGPDFVRIYPVLVVQNSMLATLYAQGQYQPLSLNKAVLMAAWMKKRFDQAGVPVVRMGLQAGEELEKSFIAGPWHPAFGELVQSRLMFNQTRRLLGQAEYDSGITLSVSAKDESVFRGMKSQNIKRLRQLSLVDSIKLVFDPDQPRHTVVQMS